MARQTANTATSAQGSGGDADNLFDHIVTQEDLDNNEDLTKAGVKVGDIIQLPAKEDDQPKGDLLTAETHEWVEQIVASNQAVIGSNDAVINSNAKLIDAFEQFKELSSRKVGNYEQAISAQVEDTFDEFADYEVAPGKSFRDSRDFTKEFTEGDDVMHLDIETLKRLHSQGYIVEA